MPIMTDSASNMKLKFFSILESHDKNDIELSFPNIELDSFNLFIGNNAQGKTRLFRVFRFMKGLLLRENNSRVRLLTNFVGKFRFETSNGGKIEDLVYEIEIIPSNEGNYYSEKIERNGRIVLSTAGDKKTLLDEQTKDYIDNFFVPSYTPALAAITDSRFETIKLIREFFLRMLILDSTKNIDQIIDTGALVLNGDASNLPDVLFNWKDKWPNVFQEVVSDFKRCFSEVEDIKFQDLAVTVPGRKPVRLAIREAGIKREISQENWSGGFGRTLSILCLPKSQFEFDGNIYPPSIIFIDEVDTSLDFKTLKFIVNYLKDYSTQTQIILSSHSPIMSEFVHPRDWHIVRRKGSQIRVSKPEQVEENLDEQLNFFRQKYWDFYTKHVSGSDLYDPN
jgi:energy-coupling factor transporter ATP-binding protein EcfA2